MTLTVTLVRHGNTDANNERWLQGHVDTDLNKAGLLQAKCCGECLKDQTYDHVYCSDLNRCKQTASAILAHHPNLTISYEFGLRERDFGKLSRQPLKYLTSESTRQHLTVDEFIAQHDGETEAMFRPRVLKAYEAIIQEAKEKQYESILIVSHGGPLKFLSMYWIENGYTAVDGLVVAPVAQGNTAVTRINYDDKVIEEFNSTSHLKDQNQNQPPPPAV